MIWVFETIGIGLRPRLSKFQKLGKSGTNALFLHQHPICKQRTMPLDKKDALDILETAAAWLVAVSMFLYGFGKVVQFGNMAALDTPVSQLTGMQLMWAFYGHSKAYALVLGAFEVLGGLLLLFRKTRLLGCLLLTAILFNVILQDIFYGVNAGALRAAIIYQGLVACILWRNRAALVLVFRALTARASEQEDKKKTLAKVLLAFAALVLLKMLEMYGTH